MRRTAVLSLVSTVFMAGPAGSAAQGVPSDPEADSPSGVVYEIPVEQARKDAAPKRGSRDQTSSGSSGGSGGGGTGGSSSSGGGSGSAGGDGSPTAATHTKQTSIRSDNNFGTSSHVPGASGGGRDATGGGEAPSALEEVARSSAATPSGPSDGIVYPLVALLVAVGAGIGIVAGRRALGGQGG